jgi:magnesium-transporting ATPase (P-type)
LARTLAVNALVMGQVFYLLNTRAFSAPAYTLSGLTGNKVVPIAIVTIIGLQLLLTYAPFMNTLFDTVALGFQDWVLCILVGFGVFVLVEGEKMLQRRGYFPFTAAIKPPLAGVAEQGNAGE